MKKVAIIVLIVLTFMLASCSGTATNNKAIGQNKDEYFEVKIFTDKGLYSPNDPIVCYATVEYIGEGDGITVYNYDPLVWFSIEGGGIYGRSVIEGFPVMTEFKRGVPVRCEFEKSGSWDTEYGGDKIFYDGKKLFLSGGEYKFSAYMRFWDKDDYLGLGHIVSAKVQVNVQQFPTESIIVFIIVGLIFVCFPSFFRLNFKLKQIRSFRHMNDYEQTANHDPSFEDKLKSVKLNPQKVITFGQNRIAIDSIKKKLFVRSSKAIDGVLLDYSDIVSYELIKDGKVIAKSSGGGYIDGAAAAGEDGIICSDLRLVITTKKPSDPEVILPFISFSIDSEFAYKEAFEAARAAAEVLDGILRYFN